MRVVHVTRDFPPRSCGGISTAVGGLAEALVADGCSVGVVSFDGYRPKVRRGAGATRDDRDGIDILRVSDPDDLDAARTFVGAPDVLHVHDGMLWAFASSCDGRRTVFTPHVVHAALNRVRGITERTMSLVGQERALNEADVVLAPSEAARRMLGRPEVGVAPLGIAPAEALPPSKGATLLHVGRFDVAKGTDDLLRIALQVLEGRPDAVLEVAGGIPENRKAERRRRRRWSEVVPGQLAPRVRLLGWLSTTDLDAAFRRATVVVQPSRIETVGLAVCEAMARGRVVVTTRCGGPEERIEDGVDGRLVHVGDLDGCVGAIDAALDDPKGRHAMEVAAAHKAREWTWDRVVGRWRHAYTMSAMRSVRVS